MAIQITCDNPSCPSSVTADAVPLGGAEAYHETPDGGVWRYKPRMLEAPNPSHWYRRHRLHAGEAGEGHLHACSTACADAIDLANLGS